MKQDAHQKNHRSYAKHKQYKIALDSLSDKEITDIAKQHNVARGTVYHHKNKAEKAIESAYLENNDNKVLFYLPVTKQFIAQLIVALYVICKASCRDTIQFIKDIFDYSVSVGQVHNTLDDATLHAMVRNDKIDLTPITDAASDEIFHQNNPILATVDIRSRFCASLSKELTRCQNAWGCELLDMQKQGFNPKTALIDGAKGLRSGYEQVFPDLDLQFDHFHITQKAKDTVRHLKNLKESSLTAAVKLAEQRSKAKDTSEKKETDYGVR